MRRHWGVGSAADRFAAELVEELGERRAALGFAEEFAELPLVRAADSNKGTFGHVLLVAGVAGKKRCGDAWGRMALRAGAGLVTIATPAVVLPMVAAAQAEYMTVPLQATRAGTMALKNVQGEHWKKIEKGKVCWRLARGWEQKQKRRNVFGRWCARRAAGDSRCRWIECF